MPGQKDTALAYVLWVLCFAGLCGMHRLYAGKWITGLLWLLTVGLLGVGQFIDLFLIPGMIRRRNAMAFGNHLARLAPAHRARPAQTTPRRPSPRRFPISHPS